MSSIYKQNNFITAGFALLVIPATVASYILIFNFELTMPQLIISAPFVISFLVFLLHCNFNLVHLASHRVIHKNKMINGFFGHLSSILGGVTLADFTTTHQLHHANVKNHDKDPDHWISTSGPFWTMPFKIFSHDHTFFSQGLWKKRQNWLGYVIDRAAQISLLLAISLTGNMLMWTIFWLVPMYIVGYLNGIYLFYFPHYSTKLENKLRASKNPNFLGKVLLTTIDISRLSHFDHHKSIQNVWAYFTLSWYIKQQKNKNWEKITAETKLEYTDLEFLSFKGS